LNKEEELFFKSIPTYLKDFGFLESFRVYEIPEDFLKFVHNFLDLNEILSY
jgi:hypothetical protein